MKTNTIIFLFLFWIAGLVLIGNSNSLTGHVILKDSLTLCKNTLDCPGGSQCCYISGAEGGFCSSENACQKVSAASKTTKDLNTIVDSVNTASFFSGINCVAISVMVCSLLGLVFSLWTKNDRN